MRFTTNGLLLACALIFYPLAIAQSAGESTSTMQSPSQSSTQSSAQLATQSAVQASQTLDNNEQVAPSCQPAPVDNSSDAASNKQQLFTVGSGYANGVYYMFGNLISALASHPNGSLVCDKGGSCGAENITMVNLSSEGSVANLQSLREGSVDSAFAQSNITYWAYTASGLYEAQEPQQNLRAIASFYPEMMQLVARKDSDISQLSDLSGKVVSLGAPDSGTLTNVRQVLTAFGIDEKSFDARLIDLRETNELFAAGELDAFFFVGGIPTPMINHAASTQGIKLIPITSSQSDTFLSNNNYYTSQVIPAGTYPGVNEDTETFAVAALWLTNDTTDDELVYNITKAIWTIENRPYWMERLLPDGGLDIDHALDGIGIPLHPGAKRYYNEIGKRY